MIFTVIGHCHAQPSTEKLPPIGDINTYIHTQADNVHEGRHLGTIHSNMYVTIKISLVRQSKVNFVEEEFKILQMKETRPFQHSKPHRHMNYTNCGSMHRAYTGLNPLRFQPWGEEMFPLLTQYLSFFDNCFQMKMQFKL